MELDGWLQRPEPNSPHWTRGARLPSSLWFFWGGLLLHVILLREKKEELNQLPMQMK